MSLPDDDPGLDPIPGPDTPDAAAVEPSAPSEPSELARTPWAAVATAALGAAAVAAVQLRHGVLQILDAGSYLSGTQAFRDGHPFTTTLAPSFSNFTVLQFLDRGGRLPFVDFPLGFTSVTGVFGLVLGARHGMIAVTVLAAAIVAGLVVLGPGAVRHRSTPWVRAVFGVALTAQPTFRVAVQGALSEPVFCAVAIGLVVALTRYRRDGSRLRTAAVLAAVTGLLRFVGGGLALLPAIEHYRRHRRWRPAAGLAAGCLAPVVANVVWAGRVGGGHSFHWHGIDRTDLKLAGRSVAGMFEAHTGNVFYTLLRVGALLPWWGVVVAVVWLVAIVVALVQYVGFSVGPVPLPVAAELPLAAAGVLTAGLFAGISGFDALATPDNRIMLPALVLSACALVWLIDVGVRRLALVAAVSVLWGAVALRPWELTDQATSSDRLAQARVLSSLPAKIVVSNDADGFAWQTGKPAAYLPPVRQSLTDAPVDRAAIFSALPCALRQHDGAVVLFTGAFFGAGDDQATLDGLAGAGLLDAAPFDGGTVYTPTSASC